MLVVAGETETRYYYFYDGLGSAICLTDESGEMVEYYDYDAFGKPKIWAVDNN